MKFLHTSDLHIGKRVSEFPMRDEQKAALDQIIEIAEREKVDGIFISGDVYDKPVPSAEAVSLFDSFISRLEEMRIPSYIIAGNHDSAERISYMGEILQKRGIHVEGAFRESGIRKIGLEDEYGPLNVYLLPFLKPIEVRHALNLESEEISTYTEAIKLVIDRENIDKNERNVLLTHQFVAGCHQSESEEMLSIGGSEQIDEHVFDAFDYVALGHLHIPQGGRIRYSGSPLKYSKSEAKEEKSVTLMTLKEKGALEIEEIPIKPIHDMRIIKGMYQEIMSQGNQIDDEAKEDYLFIELNDKDYVPNALSMLRTIYKNIISIEYPNIRKLNRIDTKIKKESLSDPIELVKEFYKALMGKEMESEDLKIINNILEEQRNNEDK